MPTQPHISAFEDLPKEWKEEKISDYSCMSALLREAVVASLGNAGKPNLMLLANASVPAMFFTPCIYLRFFFHFGVV